MSASDPVPPPSPEEAPIRGVAGRILAATLRAVDPAPLVEDALRALIEGPDTEPGAAAPSGALTGSGRTAVLAVGKAAAGMAEGAVRALGPGRISRGLVLVSEGSPDPGPALPFPVQPGGHPLPTADGLRAARRALEMVRGLERDEGLLLLLSGGGSALLTLPEDGISLEDLRRVTDLLLRAGASIRELNAVRKHLERLKGGRLAVEAGPRPVTALVISDVVGDPPDVIASGPVSPDPSTYGEALEVVERHGIGDAVPPSVLSRLTRGVRRDLPETPKPGDPRLEAVEYRVVAGVGTAMDAAAREARGQGYRAHLLTSALQGEARDAGRRLGALARSVGRAGSDRPPPLCLVAGGETTVRVRGPGRGGRNQELALGAALEIAGQAGLLVASFGTDGVDGPTDAAGALATGTTVPRARAGGLDPEAALERNDSHPFFRALGDLLRTGPTGTNVMDVQLVLVDAR